PLEATGLRHAQSSTRVVDEMQTKTLTANALNPARVRRRSIVDRLDEGDRPLGDLVPVVGVEVVEHPRANRAAEQPEEHSKADEQFHSPRPIAEGVRRESRFGCEVKRLRHLLPRLEVRILAVAPPDEGERGGIERIAEPARLGPERASRQPCRTIEAGIEQPPDR